MPSSSDVPGLYDLVLNSEGYRFLEAVPLQPFVNQKALYGVSPTFVPRQNVQGDYGDNFQDFWLTWTQRDWSLGSGLKFARAGEGRDRRYYLSNSVDVGESGSVSLRPDKRSVTTAAALTSGLSNATLNSFVCSSTNMYEITNAGGITDRGAHGVGVAPQQYCMAADTSDIYVSGPDAGKTRKWNGSTWASFSATVGCVSLVHHNNSLYGLRLTDGGSSKAELGRFSSAGAWTVLYTWLDADGAVEAWTNVGRMISYGGKILFLIDRLGHVELWQYDGTGVSLLHQFPPDFVGGNNGPDMAQVNGTLFISGSSQRTYSDSGSRQTIYFYADGTVGEVWRSSRWSGSGASPVAVHENSLVFLSTDENSIYSQTALMSYDTISGRIHPLINLSATLVNGNSFLLGNGEAVFIGHSGGTNQFLYPHTTTLSSSGNVYSSLVDFDSSLDKYFRAVKIDADIPTGATIDLSYRLNDLDSSTFTSIQTGAVAGTEYNINQSGRALSVLVTLNKGSSANGPVLKKVHLRAVPLLQTFKLREYTLDLSGVDGEGHVTLHNGRFHPKDGRAQADNLNTAAALTAPFSITDRFSTYTGIIESDKMKIIEIRPNEFVATVVTREV